MLRISAALTSIFTFLFANGYIQHEKSLAKHSIDAVKRSRARQKETILFGKDNFLGLPSVPDGAPTPSSTLRATPPPATTAPASPTPIPAVEGVEDTDMDYLVRHVPKAGDRSQQVHFTMDILKNYFKLSPGNELQLQQIHDIYTPHGIENRRVVYSARRSSSTNSCAPNLQHGDSMSEYLRNISIKSFVCSSSTALAMLAS